MLLATSEHSSKAKTKAVEFGIHPQIQPRVDFALRLGAEPMRICNALRHDKEPEEVLMIMRKEKCYVCLEQVIHF